jgi:hypothetical protein
MTSRPVADLGLCIARSGNPTFANRQITLVASPRNQLESPLDQGTHPVKAAETVISSVTSIVIRRGVKFR